KLVVPLDPVEDHDSIIHQGFVTRRPPALYLTKGTHTSKPSGYAREVAESYRELLAAIARDREKEKLEEAPPKGAEERPAGQPSQAAPAPPKPLAPGTSAPGPSGTGRRGAL